MPTLRKIKELQADTQANAFAAHLIFPTKLKAHTPTYTVNG